MIKVALANLWGTMHHGSQTHPSQSAAKHPASTTRPPTPPPRSVSMGIVGQGASGPPRQGSQSSTCACFLCTLCPGLQGGERDIVCVGLSLDRPFEETAREAEFSQTFLHTCLVTKAATTTRGLALIPEDLFPACVCACLVAQL